MKIILFNEKADCCGCGACQNICPKDAIEMIEDEYGFIYPSINIKKCISCGACKLVCAYQKKTLKLNVKKTYIAISKNKNLIEKSASGGVFSTLANKFLENGGIVYGAILDFDKKIETKHIRIDKQEDLYKLQGSKYIQSNLGKIYRDVKKDLLQNKEVLFSGTPCQIDALKSFLGKIFDNLYTIDIICHGVPSNNLFLNYIRFIEKKRNIKIIDFSFRNKGKGWSLIRKIGYIGKIRYIKNNKIKEEILPAWTSSYYKLFLLSKICRINCYSCKYAKNKRCGDITIGDYWGVEKEHPEYYTTIKEKLELKKGVSCILINSEKGIDFLSLYGRELELKPSDLEKVMSHNAQLKCSSKLDNDRKIILDLYKLEKYEAVEKWYLKFIGYKKYLYFIWNKLPVKIKNILYR